MAPARTSVRPAAAALALLLLALAPSAALVATEIRFREVARDWGLDFRHHHGGSGDRYLVETTVGGVVLFDFDRDGDVDVYFVDGGHLPGYEGETPGSRLLRNEGGGRFVDVTERAGLAFGGYGSGGTAGDVDGDGDLDLYLTAFGDNALFLNQGDGSFRERGREAGVADPLWSTGAAFSDVDRDGDLDLYVVNYVAFALDKHQRCRDDTTDVEIYCPPGVYEGEADRLYLNRGDGGFEDRTAASGLAGARPSAGLGAVFGDFDGDGWDDLYVANDMYPNFLFRNRADGTFEDLSLLSGTAYSDTGVAEAGMGVEMADFDGDAQPDLVVTNFALETNALYRNIGGGLFLDHRFAANIAESSLRFLAFGIAAVDVDHDADLDLAIANGHVNDNAERLGGVGRYAQANQILENLGGGRFRWRPDVGLDVVRVSRGLAAGDLDGDGDLDLVVVNSNQTAEVYENLGGAAGGGWLQVDLESASGNAQGVGARVVALTEGRRQLRLMRTASSYLSQNAATLHWGLGDRDRVDELLVRWPDGRREALRDLPASRRLRVVSPGPNPPAQPISGTSSSAR